MEFESPMHSLQTLEKPPDLSKSKPHEKGEPHSSRQELLRLSVILPVYNEEGIIGPVVRRVASVLEREEKILFEVLVIDDGSTDSSAQEAAGAGARVIQHPVNLGNGASIKTGIRAAKGDLLVLMDGDGQHAPEEIPKLLQGFGKFQMVVGTRIFGLSHRDIANRIYSAFASYVTGKKIPDLTSGFRVVRTEVARRFLYLLPNTFSYPTTLTLSLLRAGYGIHSVPIRVGKREKGSKSKIKPLADGSRFFLIILKIATFFAPLRIFLPLSGLVFLGGISYYLYTFLSFHRFTNMGLLLIVLSSILFSLGLISEQIAQLRFDKSEER